MVNNRRKIFFDAEFCDLDTDVHFLSLAFVTDTDKKLYLELEQQNWRISDWVDENVIPKLKNERKYSHTEAEEIIRKFINENYDEDPILIADVNQFDWIGLCKIFGCWNMPFFYIPLDFASILFACGLDMDKERIELADNLNINIEESEYKKHNALYDAEMLKKMYDKLKDMNFI